MVKDLVSIIMPTFNRGNIIYKAVESVKDQTYKNWELIVVDDGSVDGTRTIFENETDSRIHYVYYNENRGGNFARNAGCALAKGEYLAFIDSDNVWSKNKLECQLSVIKESNTDICFGKVITIKGIIKKTNPDIVPNYDELIRIIKNRNIIDMNSILLRNQLLIGESLFDDKMPRLQDWDLLFKLLVVKGCSVCGINDVVDTNYIQQDSISMNDEKYKRAIFYFMEKYQGYLSLKEIIAILMESFKSGYMNYSEIINECILKLDKKEEIYNSFVSELSSIMGEMNYVDKLIGLFVTKTANFAKLKNHKIAIYGLGRLGSAVYGVLKEQNINVVCGIDKRVDDFYDLPVRKPGTDIEGIDAILITVMDDYKRILEELRGLYNCDIFTINDI